MHSDGRALTVANRPIANVGRLPLLLDLYITDCDA